MDNHYRKSGKLSLRNSIMVWIGGAVLGWALMVVSIYNVLRFPTEEMAGNQLVVPPGPVAVDEKSLNEIAPAAGDAPATDEMANEDEEEDKDPEDEDEEEDINPPQ